MDPLSPAMRIEDYGVRDLLDSLADGVYVTDRQRAIIFWNRAAARITGWSAEDVVGRTCSDNLLNHIDVDGHELCGQDFCPLHRAMVTGESSAASVMVSAKHKDGRRVPVEVSVAPIRSGSGEVVGGIEVFRDLTLFMDDLRRARLIQDHLLDCPLAADARVDWETRYVPEEIVGGDFYRIERIQPNIYTVMIADVMGHGVASALFTMQLRSLWEECRCDLDSPARFLAALNCRLHRLVSADGYFATAFVARLDAASGALRYVRAGHPPALRIGLDGRIDPLDQRSPALGLLDSALYKETETRLEPGDTLLWFTDGAIEIVGPEGAVLGLDGLAARIRETLRLEGRLKLDCLERQLLSATGGLRLPDDLTLIRVQWNGASAQDASPSAGSHEHSTNSRCGG